EGTYYFSRNAMGDITIPNRERCFDSDGCNTNEVKPSIPAYAKIPQETAFKITAHEEGLEFTHTGLWGAYTETQLRGKTETFVSISPVGSEKIRLEKGKI